MPWLHGWKGSYKSSGTYTNKVRSMSIVYFSSGEGNSITDLSQDTGGNRLMRMMIMIMMMCCDWHCSHCLSGKKKQHVCRDAKHILNHNLFAGDPNLFWPVGLGFEQRKIQTKKGLILKQFPTWFCTKVQHANKTSAIVVVHVPPTNSMNLLLHHLRLVLGDKVDKSDEMFGIHIICIYIYIYHAHLLIGVRLASSR